MSWLETTATQRAIAISESDGL
jgi:hypothetical protein